MTTETMTTMTTQDERPAPEERGDMRGFAMNCETATLLKQLHYLTADALTKLGDYSGASYFHGLGNGVVTGAC